MSAKSNVTDFRTTGYFGGLVIFLGFLLVFLAIVLAGKSVVGLIICLVTSAVIFTTHYRLRLDFKNQTYHDYLWLMGMKIGERGRFEAVDYIFVKPSKIRQTMNSRGSSSTISKVVIDAYIRLSPENNIHLFTRDSKHDALAKARDIARLLNARIMDYTTPEPSEVENH